MGNDNSTPKGPSKTVEMEMTSPKENHAHFEVDADEANGHSSDDDMHSRRR